MTALMVIGWIGAGAFPLFMGVVPSETLSLRRAATAMGLVIGVARLWVEFKPPHRWCAGRSFSLSTPLILAAALPLLAAVLALGLIETNPRFATVPAGAAA